MLCEFLDRSQPPFTTSFAACCSFPKAQTNIDQLLAALWSELIINAFRCLTCLFIIDMHFKFSTNILHRQSARLHKRYQMKIINHKYLLIGQGGVGVANTQQCQPKMDNSAVYRSKSIFIIRISISAGNRNKRKHKL